MEIDWKKEVDIGIGKITRNLKVNDAKQGKLKCKVCGSKLRYTIHGTLLCPKCLREFK